MDERSQAAQIADRLLDEPYADPDDDSRVVCRQFNRSQEEIQRLKESLQANIAVSKQRDSDVQRLRGALETLWPGLVLDLRYADDDDDKDAMRARIQTVEEALGAVSASTVISTEGDNSV